MFKNTNTTCFKTQTQHQVVLKHKHNIKMFKNTNTTCLKNTNTTSTCFKTQTQHQDVLKPFTTTSQDLPMKNIVFDGVRVLQAENSDLEKYHTCKGDLQNSMIR